MDDLLTIASRALEANRVETTEGPVTVAGAHQFKTFWVRDFCFAVPGLMALGHLEQVRDQLAICLRHMRQDGLIARGFDVLNPKVRVVAESFRIPRWRSYPYQNRPLKAEFLGEHGTPAIDSNLLVLLACLQWQKRTGEEYFFVQFGEQMKRAFRHVGERRNDDLLVQPAFSDWQDSARREGATFYLNLLYLRVLRGLRDAGISWANESVDEFRQNLWRAFFDSNKGLFRSQVGRDQYALETQLWAIEEDLFSGLIGRMELFANLKSSPLWKDLPGRPVAPEYPSADISWTTKFVGLRHYHDRFHWSWLIGESLKVSEMMGARVDGARIRAVLEKVAREHGTIHEIYEWREELVPVRRPLYRSEAPFSWGAAKIVEALTAIPPRT